MILRRRLAAAVSGAVLLIAAPALAQTTAPSAPWAQGASDLPADPAVRFGQLPNGMRYAILRNATPPGQASLRLRIDAGSLMERDDQQGLAHFMEHMAFNGTTHIPENELLRILERLGLAFGADTNAATSFDQTYYQLELPRTNDETVDASLRILREQVSEALMDPAAIDEERGVIQGEARTRNTPALRALKAQLALLAPGQRLSQRLPIGDLEVIRTAPRERFVDFYEAYYRPSRATLIAVGDFDPEQMETKIRAAFADWTGDAPDGPEPDLGVVAAREPETSILVEPGVQSTIQLNWVRPPDLDPDTFDERRDDILRGLGLAVLNRRLGELARADNAPFLGAGASASSLFDSLDLTTVSAAFAPGRIVPAVQAVEQEQRRLVQYGVTEAELAREITDARTALKAAVDAAATRTTPGLANSLLGAVNDDRVFTSPAAGLEVFERAVAGLTPAQVDAAVKTAFDGQGPAALVVTPVEIEGGEAAVTAALQASRQVAVAPRAEAARLDWPYQTFGAPVREVSRTEIADLGVTQVAFANGVRLTVKPTDFRDEQILISVSTGLGDRGLPADRVTAQALAPFVFTQGGLGKLTLDEVTRTLSGKVYSVGFALDDTAYRLSGSTRAADLQTELQLITAYLTDPGLRAAPFTQFQAAYPQFLEQLAATPGGVFQRDLPGLLTGGDRRAMLPTAAEVAAIRLDDLKRQVTAGLARGPVEVVMVGDVTVDAAVQAVAGTLAALPARGAAATPAPGADRVRFPAPTAEPVRLTHSGPADQALGFVAWPTTDALGDRSESRALSLLSAIFQLRLNEEIREKQGLAYSPRAGSVTSSAYPDYGYLQVTAETPPDALPTLFQAVDAIAASLRDTPVDADELTRARAPAVESLRRSQAGNEYWLNQLQLMTEDPNGVEEIRSHIADLEAVTPQEIQRLARQYLKPETAWRATITAAQP